MVSAFGMNDFTALPTFSSRAFLLYSLQSLSSKSNIPACFCAAVTPFKTNHIPLRYLIILFL